MADNSGALPVETALSKMENMMPYAGGISFTSPHISGQRRTAANSQTTRENKQHSHTLKPHSQQSHKQKSHSQQPHKQKSHSQQPHKQKSQPQQKLHSQQPSKQKSQPQQKQSQPSDKQNLHSSSLQKQSLSKRIIQKTKTKQSNKKRDQQQPPLALTSGTVDLSKVLERLDSMNKRLVTIEGTNSSMDTEVKALQHLFKSMNERLVKLEASSSAILKAVKEITSWQTPKSVERPAFLPFETSADILAFNISTAEDYNHLVNYLRSLGGVNFTDAAAKYFKSSIMIDQDIFCHVNWTSKKANKVVLKNTHFAKACQDAMPASKETLQRPKVDEFNWVMTKALKSAKEGFRRTLKRPAQGAVVPRPGQPEVKRQRIIAENVQLTENRQLYGIDNQNTNAEGGVQYNLEDSSTDDSEGRGNGDDEETDHDSNNNRMDDEETDHDSNNERVDDEETDHDGNNERVEDDEETDYNANHSSESERDNMSVISDIFVEP